MDYDVTFGQFSANIRFVLFPWKCQLRWSICIPFFFQENKEDVTVKSDVNGFKRAGPLATLLSNEKVQEAAVDKGIDIAGKLVDKQMQIVDDAQKKASDFLANEVRSAEQDFNSTVYNKQNKRMRYVILDMWFWLS